jgi:hypothetical protein
MVYTYCLIVYTIQKWHTPWGNLPDEVGLFCRGALNGSRRTECNCQGGRKRWDNVSRWIKILPLPEEKQAGRGKNEQFPLFFQLATARHSHRWMRPTVYMLKGKVSWLLLMAIILTASSNAALQACCKAAARWGNAQAVTPCQQVATGSLSWLWSELTQLISLSQCQKEIFLFFDRHWVVWAPQGPFCFMGLLPW